MANDWWTDDDDDDNEPPKRNELPEPARKHLRKVEQELKQLREENSALKSNQRKTNVTDIVKAKGYNPAIASFVPADVEVTDESIGKWLEQHGELFAKPSANDTSPGGTVVATDENTAGFDIPSELSEAMNLIGNISAGAVTPQKPADLMKQIQTSSPDELIKLLKSQGATV